MDLTEDHDSDLEDAVNQDDLNRLKIQHTHLEKQLSELEDLKFPTDSEESQIKQLKIEKLIIKQKLERLHLQET